MPFKPSGHGADHGGQEVPRVVHLVVELDDVAGRRVKRSGRPRR